MKATKWLFIAWSSLGVSGCVFSSSFCETYPDQCGKGGGGASASTTSTMSTTASGNTTSSGSSMSQCTPGDPSTCPTPTSDCLQATCDAGGKCQESPKAPHDPCATSGPQKDAPGVCDGAAVCIGCIDPTDCPKDAMGMDELCPTSGPNAHTCVPAGCTNGQKDGAETDVDCGGGACPGCAVGDDCASNTDCATGACDPGTHLCKECASSVDCDAANYCDTNAAPLKICKAKEAQGVACSLGDGQCTTSHCVDGFCCSSACNTTCNSCNGAATGQPNGSCAPIPSGMDPDAECDVAGAGCKTGACDGVGACGFKPAGSLCGMGPVCVNPTTSNPQDMCVGGADVCNTGMNMPCMPNFSCTNNACNTTCTTNAQCIAGRFCETDAPSAKKNTCQVCTSVGQCSGGLKCEESTSSPFEDTCVQCRQSGSGAATDCMPGMVCHPATDLCVECFQPVNCAGNMKGSKCLPGNVCGCTSDGDCFAFPAKPHCAFVGPNTNTCQQCNNNADCASNNAGHACGPTSGLQNVCGCNNNFDCNGTPLPICNTSTHQCQ